MLETALYLAMACAVCGALARNRTAWVLLPSVAICLLADWQNVEFNRVYWILLDVAVASLIAGLTWPPGPINRAIIALFPIGWAFYFLPDPYRYSGSVSVTIIQLLLTFPARIAGQKLHRFVERWKANFQNRDEWTDLERRGRREADA